MTFSSYRKLAIVGAVAILAVLAALYVVPSQHAITVRAGDMIEFGGYDWRVFEVSGNNAKIITENVIIMEEGRFNSFWGPTTWEASALRRYLNDEFLTSFSVEDRARIQETYIVNTDNPWYGTLAGNDTTERIFLLSLEEVVQYFGDSGQLENQPAGLINSQKGIMWINDEYNSARIGRDEAGSALWWWLRSPGEHPRLRTGVDPAGVISFFGTGASNTTGGSRPVLWLDATGIQALGSIHTND